MKKTKVVCTLGPASENPETLALLIKAGMNVARLNFSHGTLEDKKRQLDLVRQVAGELHEPIAIMADLQGPKLRLGDIDGVRQIEQGDSIRLSHVATHDVLPTQIDLAEAVKPGERILLNDGLVELHVDEVHEGVIRTTAKNGGWVSSQKGINIPDSTYTGEVFTEKDAEGLEFAIRENLDYVALSFVRGAADILYVKSLIETRQSRMKVIAKIEQKDAVRNVSEIIHDADGVMVARGDLAIETSPSEVPIIQLRIIRIARQFQKPVIVATQMLESMIENPRPTRAEATDIAHAVMYQVDAIMLSGESAAGKYPVEAVQVMSEIIQSVEHSTEFKHYIKINWEDIEKETLRLSAIASTAASFAYRSKAACLAVATATGLTARIISSFRPEPDIVAVTHDERTRNQLNLLWGVTPIVVAPAEDSDLFWKKTARELEERGFVHKGDMVIMVAGTHVGVSGETDTIRIVTL